MKITVKLTAERWQHILKLLATGKTAIDVICAEYISDALQSAAGKEKADGG